MRTAAWHTPPRDLREEARRGAARGAASGGRRGRAGGARPAGHGRPTPSRRRSAVRSADLIIKGEDYAYAQPSLVAHKRRKLEPRAGLPAHRGRPGKATGYSLHAVRAAERDLAAQAEAAYRTIVAAAWQPTRPAVRPSCSTDKVHARSGVDAAATTGVRLPQGPLGPTRRGRADSPTPCSFATGPRYRPTAAERYAGPRRGQGQGRRPRCAAGP